MTKAESTAYKVLALLLLCLGTIALFNNFERYLVIGPELLTDNRFQDKLQQWQYSSPGTSVPQPGSGIAVLQSENPDDIISLTQTISKVDFFKLLRLSCELKTSNIPLHEGGWNVARVVLVSNNREGEPVYSRHHMLVALSGKHNWEYHEGVFPVYPDSASVNLSVQIAQSTGTLWVKNLSLRPLAAKRSFRKYRSIALTLWALAGIWIIAPMVKSAFGNAQRTLVLALALAVAVGVLMPESVKEHIGNTLFPSLAHVTGGMVTDGTFQFLPLLRTPDIYKVGHFFLFALLAAVALYRRPYALSHSGTFACLILFALITEVLQLFIPGRTALLSDVFVDSAGMVVGLALQRILLSFTRSR